MNRLAVGPRRFRDLFREGSECLVFAGLDSIRFYPPCTKESKPGHTWLACKGERCDLRRIIYSFETLTL